MTRSIALHASLYAPSIVLVLGCTTQQGGPSRGESGAQAAPAQAAPAQAADSGGWRSLSGPGALRSAWRGYQSDTIPIYQPGEPRSGEWQVRVEMPSRKGTLVKHGRAGDIITRDQFGDFELAFDWKLERGGNAGVFYRGTEEYDHIYWSAPEYQLLDDAAHRDGGDRLTAAGAAYGLYPSPAGVVRPGGEWNSSRIVVRGSRVEHWLNERKVVEYELGSPDWESRVKASKFIDYPKYGRARRGHIGIQGDHEGTLEIRDMRIRELR